MPQLAPTKVSKGNKAIAQRLKLFTLSPEPN